ncbi:hypothetical protein PF002_g24748 [Phytophthora fragariae]|nr:hypothetical protein PF007_g23918 [Phytophthora fragariae]KAE9099737.1 hypothetical protein PF006_g23069 [Phytophthora fragariae]KAE9190510.1 hypothetical protein PF002_g24748 [Phytophthora fragariae]KAE9282930.1 hypothetical protein PF001_g23080 [Phytophthora fragariae]
MQLHITVAYSVIVNPAFYVAERLTLGMHKRKPRGDLENPVGYVDAATPDVTQGEPRRSFKMSYVSVTDAENEHKGDVEEEMTKFRGRRNTVKYVVLRVVIVFVLVVLAIVFKDHFSDFANFVGASCITVNLILLPIVFYVVKAWPPIPMYEEVAAIVVTAFSLEVTTGQLRLHAANHGHSLLVLRHARGRDAFESQRAQQLPLADAAVRLQVVRYGRRNCLGRRRDLRCSHHRYKRS